MPLVVMLLCALAVGGCAAPWACTADTCLSVATAPLPPGVAGHWESAAGSQGRRLRVDFFRREEDDSVVQRAALLTFEEATAAWQSQQLASFDGVVMLAEQRLADDPQAPRRFHRLTLADGRLTLATLPASTLAFAVGVERVRVVSTAGGPALSYTELVPVATALRALLGDPTAWIDERVFVRRRSGPAALNARPAQPPAPAGSDG